MIVTALLGQLLYHFQAINFIGESHEPENMKTVFGEATSPATSKERCKNYYRFYILICRLQHTVRLARKRWFQRSLTVV